MVYRRECPKIRACIESDMVDYGWSLQEFRGFTSYDPDCIDWTPIFYLSHTWKIQFRKMIEEKKQGGF